MATELTDMPENIGRNDPCPCGSGKKYKKCCMRLHQVQREAAQESRGVEDLINAETIPWEIYKLLQQAHENNMFSLFYDMTHECGPFRKRYPEKADYLRAADAGEELLPASPDFDFRRMRLDPPNVHVLLTGGLHDPHTEVVQFDVITLRRNEIDADGEERNVEDVGLRIWDISHHQRKKAELEDYDLGLSDLGMTWEPVS